MIPKKPKLDAEGDRKKEPAVARPSHTRPRPDAEAAFAEKVARASRPTVQLRARAERSTVRQRRDQPAAVTTDERGASESQPGDPSGLHLSLDAVPRMIASGTDLANLPLDPRDAFLTSQIDGATSIQTLIDVTGLPPNDVLATLARLVALGIATVG